MEPSTLCLLCFPQYYKDGKITFNIVLIPRNLNPLLPITAGLAAFADANVQFKSMVIDHLDGLPITTDAVINDTFALEQPSSPTRKVWEALKKQLAVHDGLKIDDAESAKPSERAGNVLNKYKDRSIRKYLPESYRNSFNFVRPKTKYALSGDEYACAIKNNNQHTTDENTQRDTVSWGKVVAFCLRNPVLAAKAGLIYKASITIDISAKVFENGGYLYTDIVDGTDLADASKLIYATRIPPLKDLTERTLFSPVQFPVLDAIVNNAAYDEILKESVIYDDGFAKIVHANQPVNQDLLQEKDKSNPPLKDIGIRLGWDDEQIAIWFNRQMLQTEEKSGLNVDAPLGVFGYRLDVKKRDEDEWLSQNSLVVRQTTALSDGSIVISNSGDIIEPPVEVHPSAHGNSAGDGFWLPMYFSSWSGKPITMADKDATEINMLTPDKMVAPRPDIQNTINAIPKPVFNPYDANPEFELPLTYGEDYKFRVRLMDISGGGPSVNASPLNGGEKPVATVHFKRHVAAGPLTLVNLKKEYDLLEKGTTTIELKDTSILQNILVGGTDTLKIKRPLLGYPSVVFTGKYTNAVEKLKSILSSVSGERAGVDIGLPDPDVTSFRIRVEVKGLEMDNARSENGREPYFLLYQKDFLLDSAPDDYNQEFQLQIVNQDIDVIDLENGFNEVGTKNQLVLPTSRHLRLTFLPIIAEANNDYADISIAEGKKIVLTSYQPSTNEQNLLTLNDGGYKGVYLQPEQLVDQHLVTDYGDSYTLNHITSHTPIELSRLANAFNISAHNLTLEGEKGIRIQFGCSKLMRHSLAPDSSSITFSSLGELFNHWIIGVNLTIQRDWTWDGLEKNSIFVFRSWEAKRGGKFGERTLVGIINISDTASMNSLQSAERRYSRLLFFDAFDPKDAINFFPTEVNLKYDIEINYAPGVQGHDNLLQYNGRIALPVTIIPKQLPKLISAGVAMSPYTADMDRYSFTEQRQRFLWFEMESDPADKMDTYFARVLANAPDPYLCGISEQLIKNDPLDTPLNIDDEKIRMIIKDSPHDTAGIGAMQELIRGEDESGKSSFYMLPLPPGLHADSDELFGFFSYEIRVGHTKEVWSTAQGRYGRPLRVNGVQHPAPNLSCTVIRRKTAPMFANVVAVAFEDTKNYRGELLKHAKKRLPSNYKSKVGRDEIVITAPFAAAVLNGEDVSAKPPQTSLWYMLYAQFRQADAKSYRNLLLKSANMPYNLPKKYNPSALLANNIAREGTKYGSAIIKVDEVKVLLESMGLPPDTSLSVLCVEMFPLDNKWSLPTRNEQFSRNYQRGEEMLNPLTTGLGAYRIYRTSQLVPVANVCCDDC